MARTLTTTSYRAESVDRALLRASAQSWRALAITAAALMLLAPLLVIGVLVLVEAALTGPKSLRVDRSVPGPGPTGWRTGTPHLMSFRAHGRSLRLQRA
jgi:hypothetical protein